MMGQRGWWLLVLALVYGAGGQERPQSHWWETPQRSVAGQGNPPRWGNGQGAGGYGVAGRWSQPAWGSQGRSMGAPRQVIQAFSPVSLACGEDLMTAIVQLNLYGDGRMVSLSDLSMGPQACPVGPKSTGAIAVFEKPLQDCSSPVQMTEDWIIYSTFLTYSPRPASNIPIYRISPATVPIDCLYPRHGNVSSKAIKPTWVPFSTTITSEDKLAFSLHLMTDDWSNIRSSSTFVLGEVFHIEASVDIQNHMPVILFVDRCVATLTEDPTSTPNYDIITANGCLVDGMQPDASSVYQQRIQANKVQFSVDAFRFLNEARSKIYITCYLRVVPATQVPDPMSKACSYSKATKSWTPLEGSTSICQCCSTRTCSGAPSGQSGVWGSAFGRPRGFMKREVGGHSEHGQATLGPLIVVGTMELPALQKDFSKASTTTQESKPMELWVLVAVVSVSMVVVAAGISVIVKRLLNKSSLKDTVEK